MLILSYVCFRLVDGHPNTYTFTKHLAENIAKDYDHLFPVIIFRPSVGK